MIRAAILLIGLSGLVDGCACSTPGVGSGWSAELPSVSSSATASSSTSEPAAAPSSAQTPPSDRFGRTSTAGDAASTATGSDDRPAYRLPRGIGPASAGKCTAPDLRIDVHDPHHIALEEEIFGHGVGEVSVTESPDDCP